MVGLDVTLQTLLTYKETQQWRDLNTKAGDFLADMTDSISRPNETTSPHLGGCGLHDPLAVGVAVDPTLVTTLPINLQVDVEGPTRGRTIGDNTRLNDPVKTMQAAVGRGCAALPGRIHDPHHRTCPQRRLNRRMAAVLFIGFGVYISKAKNPFITPGVLQEHPLAHGHLADRAVLLHQLRGLPVLQRHRRRTVQHGLLAGPPPIWYGRSSAPPSWARPPA